jgi:hypothetical protein
MSKTNWWMYHGDPAHTGLVKGSRIDTTNVATLKLLHDIDLPGPVLSVRTATMRPAPTAASF